MNDRQALAPFKGGSRTRPKVWDGVTAVALIYLTALAHAELDTWHLAALVMVAAAYILVWRPWLGAMQKQPHQTHWMTRAWPSGREVFTEGTLVAVGIAVVAFDPLWASCQWYFMPTIWILASSLYAALFYNFALVIGIGAVLITSGPSSQTGLWVIVEVLALTFSIAMGIWISRIEATSNKRQALLDRLHAAQEQLAEASRLAGVSAERERLARELHDTVAQSLAGLVMQLDSLERRAARGIDVTAALAEVTASAREALRETRGLVSDSASVAGVSLAEALRRLAERTERETGIRVSVEGQAPDGMTSEVELAAVRIVQESLANARKHAHASNIAITVSGTNALEVSVADDGHGFNLDGVTKGFGLTSLQERAQALGGEVTLTSDASGTNVHVRLPLGTQEQP